MRSVVCSLACACCIQHAGRLARVWMRASTCTTWLRSLLPQRMSRAPGPARPGLQVFDLMDVDKGGTLSIEEVSMHACMWVASERRCMHPHACVDRTHHAPHTWCRGAYCMKHARASPALGAGAHALRMQSVGGHG